MSRFAGKVAVVTGAASGLGQAVARAYASEGAGLMLLDIESGTADPRLSELGCRLVRIPGYVVAVEDLRSGTPHFPLVPYVGAYVHTPAPRANQALAVDAGGDAVESEVGDHIGSAAASRSRTSRLHTARRHSR